MARYPETTPRLTAERMVSSTVVETNIVLKFGLPTSDVSGARCVVPE
jgi:hypothetical protein